jgi:P4 family phage/plasmid primase-like protien
MSVQLSIKDFAVQNSLNVCPVVYTNKNYTAITGWKQLSLVESHNLKVDNSKGFIISLKGLHTQFVVLDTDDEKAFNYVNNIIDKYDLKEVSTLSNSGLSKKLNYKRHFYFKLPKTNFECKKVQFENHPIYGKLDVIFDIAEHKDNKISCDMSELPIELLKEYYKIDDSKKEEVKPKQPKVNKVEANDNTNNDILITILENLNEDRFNNYSDWFKIACIFVNEKLDLDVFDQYSQKSPKYNNKSNELIIKNLKKNNNGYRIATLYFMLKEDNYTVWKDLQSKRKDFWEIMEKFNHTDIANLFFNMYPEKYIYSNKCWYELNEFNIYKEIEDYKNTLFNNISIAIQNLIIEQRNLIIPSDEHYMAKNKVVKNNYNAIGNSNFKKGVIESLCGFYYIENISEKLNSKNNLIAFKNKVYDVEVGEFRDIKPSDYISITTKYNAPETSNKKYREKINKLLYSIFEDNDIIDYWLKTVGLSLFTNKFESLYIHTGGGRNGKGVMGDILSKALGEYYQQANSDLLTGEIKSATNPTLANARYTRLLVLSEPDDSGKDYKLKTSLVKSITGGDIITVRDLYKSNVSYKPLFTVILQCNKKPAIDKIDKAIEERLKVVHYPFTFVDSPSKENERLRDYNLKEMINNDLDFIREFMLLLLETASKNYKLGSIQIPKKVKDKNDEYFNENNPVKEFINDKCIITNNDKDRIASKELFDLYDNDDSYLKLSSIIKFSEAMASNGFIKVKIDGKMIFKGLKIKPVEKPKEDLDI